MEVYYKGYISVSPHAVDIVPVEPVSHVRASGCCPHPPIGQILVTPLAVKKPAPLVQE